MKTPKVKVQTSNLLNKQTGNANWSILLGLLLAAVIIGQLILVFPVFVNNYQINAAMHSLKEVPDIQRLSKQEIHQLFLNRLGDKRARGVEINEIEVRTDPRLDRKVIRIHYEAIVTILDDVSVVTSFSDTVSI